MTFWAEVGLTVGALGAGLRATRMPPLSPPFVMQTWYAQRAGQQYGPFDDATLVDLVRKGQLVGDDWLSSDAGGHWQQARAVAGLFPQAVPAAPAVPLQPVTPLQAHLAAPMPGQLAAIPLQPLASGTPPAFPPVAAPMTPAYVAPAAMPGVAGTAPVAAYTAAPAEPKRVRSRGDSLRWSVLLLMALLLLLFWYVWLNPVASPLPG